MTTWTIKFQTDDLALAHDIFDDLRYKGYSAWIEDESGKAVDEKSLQIKSPAPTDLTLKRLTGPLVF